MEDFDQRLFDDYSSAPIQEEAEDDENTYYSQMTDKLCSMNGGPEFNLNSDTFENDMYEEGGNTK